MRGLGYILLFTLYITLSEPQCVLAQNAVNPLIPFTSEKDLRKCSEELNYNEEFEKALTCSDKPLKGLSRLDPIAPKCYIIITSSPDVHKGKLFNFISMGSIFDDQVLGFYEPKNKTIYAVDNKDVKEVIRHELQHYFLDILYDEADAGHQHKIWKKCESARYNPLK